MTLNFPGPYEVELQYSTTVNSVELLHYQRLNCSLQADVAVGTPFSSCLVLRRSGGAVALSTALDAWVALLRPIYDDTAATFIGANLYKYQDASFVKDFRSSYTIGLNGTDTTNVSPARQDTFTFHTQEGGEMRIVLLESNLTFIGIDRLPMAVTAMDNIADFVISDQNWFKARDTSFPLSVHAWLGGQNEKTFRQRYR